MSFTNLTIENISRIISKGALEDLSRLKVKGWWNVAKDRDAWKTLLMEAEAQSGLWS